MDSNLTVVVTGGAGYLGSVLVDQLLEGSVLEVAELRVFDRRQPATTDERLRFVEGDVRDAAALSAVCRGADLVFHCAAIVDWGRVSERDLEDVNVGGTRQVVEACLQASVSALVHTSTMDVVYTGGHIVDGDESLPLATRFANGYCRTKTLAEQVALAASGRPLAAKARNGRGEIAVAAVRPCCVFGEHDPFHIGSLIEMAERGKLMRVGDGSSRSQFTYVGNVAHLHLLAGQALLAGNAGAGQAYFVTDVPPANFFDFLAPFVEAAGFRMPERGLPRAPLYALGAFLEGLSWALRPVFRFAPIVTRFAVDFVCLDFTLSTDKAARELGYTPRYSASEAQSRTLAHYRRKPEHTVRES